MDRISLATYLSYKRYEITSTKKVQAAESRIETAQLFSKSSRILRNLVYNTVHKRPTLPLVLNQTNQIHTLPS